MENIDSLGSGLRTLSEPDSAAGPSRADGWQDCSAWNQVAPDPPDTVSSETPSPEDTTLPNELFSGEKGLDRETCSWPGPVWGARACLQMHPHPRQATVQESGPSLLFSSYMRNGSVHRRRAPGYRGGRSQAHRGPGGDPRTQTWPCPAELQVGPCLSLPLSLSIPATQRKQAAHVTRTEPSCLINPT